MCAMAPSSSAARRAGLLACAVAIGVPRASVAGQPGPPASDEACPAEGCEYDAAGLLQKAPHGAAPEQALKLGSAGCGSEDLCLTVTGTWGVDSGVAVTTPFCSPHSMLEDDAYCKVTWPSNGGTGMVSADISAPIKKGDKFSVKGRVGRAFVYVPFNFDCDMCGDDLSCPISSVMGIKLGDFKPPKCPNGDVLNFSERFRKPSFGGISGGLYLYIDEVSTPYFHFKMEGWVNIR